MKKAKKIILASKSPRRTELCEKYGIFANVVPACIDEVLPENLCEPGEIVEYLSSEKARAVAKNFSGGEIIIGADTLVFCDGKILGKPENKNEAREMMKLLSGNIHSVVSGISIICGEKEISDSVATRVTFKELSEAEIEGYISTREPYDKAGGYGIQSLGGAFVTGIDGDYYNVVGLPVSRLLHILGKEFDCYPFEEFLKNNSGR